MLNRPNLEKQKPSISKENNGKQVVKKVYFNKRAGHNAISLLLSIFAVSVMLYIYFKYMNSDEYISRAYAQYSLLLAILGIIGYVFIDLIDDYRITLIPKKLTKADYVGTLIKTMILLIVILVVQFVTQYVVRFALTDIDMIMYYVFAGTCEELFFRAFIIGILLEGKRLFKRSKPSTMNYYANPEKVNKFESRNSRESKKFLELTIYDHLYIWFAVLISSIAFMMAHIGVYGQDPTLMATTMASGVILGIAYGYWRDLSANQLSHTLINIIAVRNLLVTF